MDSTSARVGTLVLVVSFVILACLLLAREGSAYAPIIVDRSGKRLGNLFDGVERGVATRLRRSLNARCGPVTPMQPAIAGSSLDWRDSAPQERMCYGHYIIFDLRECLPCSVWYFWGWSGGTDYCAGYQTAYYVCEGWCEHEISCETPDC